MPCNNKIVPIRLRERKKSIAKSQPMQERICSGNRFYTFHMNRTHKTKKMTSMVTITQKVLLNFEDNILRLGKSPHLKYGIVFSAGGKKTLD